jgi:hypothetical protein
MENKCILGTNGENGKILRGDLREFALHIDDQIQQTIRPRLKESGTDNVSNGHRRSGGINFVFGVDCTGQRQTQGCRAKLGRAKIWSGNKNALKGWVIQPPSAGKIGASTPSGQSPTNLPPKARVVEPRFVAISPVKLPPAGLNIWPAQTNKTEVKQR